MKKNRRISLKQYKLVPADLCDEIETIIKTKEIIEENKRIRLLRKQRDNK